MSRHRNWCITINHFTKSDQFSVEMLFLRCKFAVVGEEVGVYGTPHLQGYVSLNSPLSLAAMKRFLPRAHLTVSSGTDEQNLAYCTKEGKNIIQVGEPSVGQGSRTDITELTVKIKNCEITLEDCMFEYPELYVRYSRSLEKMFNAVMKPREFAPEVHWRWGLAGTGKTRYCIEKHPSHYVKDGTPWWDNYTQQEAIIIDDFDNSIPFRTLLRILDRYVYQGQVKGSYVQVNSPFIYITCEFPPSAYFQLNDYEQVARRLTPVQEII